MSNEQLYNDTGTPEPNLAPTSEIGILVNEIAAVHSSMGELRKMMASGLMSLSTRVISLEEQDKADRADRIPRQRHVDLLLWIGIGLACLHLVFDAIRLVRGHR